MKRLNFTCFVAMMIMMFFTCPVTASDMVNTTDATCTNVATPCDGESNDGCTSTVFTVEYTQEYSLIASIDGCGFGGTSCTDCISEVYLYQSRVPPVLITCIHSGCCDSWSTGVNLTASTYYTLYCCKINCDEDGCEACSAPCTARARVTTTP